MKVQRNGAHKTYKIVPDIQLVHTINVSFCFLLLLLQDELCWMQDHTVSELAKSLESFSPVY